MSFYTKLQLFPENTTSEGPVARRSCVIASSLLVWDVSVVIHLCDFFRDIKNCCVRQLHLFMMCHLKPVLQSFCLYEELFVRFLFFQRTAWMGFCYSFLRAHFKACFNLLLSTCAQSIALGSFQKIDFGGWKTSCHTIFQ